MEVEVPVTVYTPVVHSDLQFTVIGGWEGDENTFVAILCIANMPLTAT
jgi:hypothetical protein